VVENGSSDVSVRWLKHQKDVYLIRNKKNKGFPAGCNQGIKAAKGSELLLLNSDTIVGYHWLDNMLAALYSHEVVGAVGPMSNYVRYPQKLSVSYKSIEEMHDFARQYNATSNPSRWVPETTLVGFCFLFKRTVYERIGLLDEIFSPGNYEDDDYSLRIWQEGFALLLLGDTFIHHFGNRSFIDQDNGINKEQVDHYNDLLEHNRKIFQQKWQIDPDVLHHLRPEQIEFVK
jgi:GT2 family glycosyltransferase